MSWICPHCKHAAIVRRDDMVSNGFDFPANDGFKRYKLTAVKCPNPDCGKAVIVIKINELRNFGGTLSELNPAKTLSVIPSIKIERAKTTLLIFPLESFRTTTRRVQLQTYHLKPPLHSRGVVYKV